MELAVQDDQEGRERWYVEQGLERVLPQGLERVLPQGSWRG